MKPSKEIGLEIAKLEQFKTDYSQYIETLNFDRRDRYHIILAPKSNKKTEYSTLKERLNKRTVDAGIVFGKYEGKLTKQVSPGAPGGVCWNLDYWESYLTCLNELKRYELIDLLNRAIGAVEAKRKDYIRYERTPKGMLNPNKRKFNKPKVEHKVIWNIGLNGLIGMLGFILGKII